MIQISRAGLRVTAGAAELDALAASFTSRHLLRLPEFFDADLGRLIERRLAMAAFTPRTERGLIVEHTLADEELFALCAFVLNDPDVVSLVERLTGCGPLHSFTGRIYRRGEPQHEGEQYYGWHDDVLEGRRVALSVNLGTVPFEGGTLQLREADTHALLAEASGVHHREAVLVRIADGLEHRVTPVVGPVARTVLAGWFRAPAY